MTAFFRAPRIVAALALVALGGCGGTSERVVSYRQIDNGAMALLEDTVELRTLSDACLSAGGTAASMATQTIEQWKADNWSLVTGADAFYRNKYKTSQFQYRDKSVSLPATRDFLSWYEASHAKVSFLQRSRNNRQATCERLLNAFLAARQPVFNNDNERVYSQSEIELLFYATNHPALPSELADIPTLSAISKPVSQTPKTLYKAEQLGKAQLCASASVIPLISEWPRESFGLFCEDEYLLLECEWGNCTALEANKLNEPS